MGDDVHGHDIVLDVEQIRRWAPALGRHVTMVAHRGRPARRGALPAEPVRSQVYDEIDRWLTAYVAQR